MTDRNEYERETIEAICSPYLRAAQKRINNLEQGESMIGSHTRPEDYTFQRQASRYSGELERLRPLEPAWHSWLAGFCAVIFMVVVIVLSLAW